MIKITSRILVLVFVLGSLFVSTDVFALTIGSVHFEGPGGTVEDNANFFYDDVNNRLGIGNNTPSSTLSVTSSNSTANIGTIGQDIYFTDTGNFSSLIGPLSKIGQNISATYSGSYTARTETLDFRGSKIVANFNGTMNGGAPGSLLEAYGLEAQSVFGGSVGSNDVAEVKGISVASLGDMGTAGITSHQGLYVAADGTADENYGLWVDASGASSNYGILINTPSAAATNYALYSQSSAQSYFAGNIGIGTSSPAAKLDINGDSFIVRTAKTPSSASDTCVKGTLAWDADYTYVCIDTNTWRRSALSSW